MSVREAKVSGGRRGPTMRPPSRTRTRALATLVALAVGLLVAMQLNARDEETSRLAAESPEDLTRILADLNAEADALGRQLADLRLKLFQYRSSAERDELALEDARKRLADLQVLAGIEPVRGPGLRIGVSDPRGRVTWDQVLDLVQELRDAGAEAVAVSGIRVVASTWFGSAEPGVVVDGERLLPPYTVEAIGSGSGMREALAIPGGPLSVMEAQPEVTVHVQEVRLRLPAVREEAAFEHARPAG